MKANTHYTASGPFVARDLGQGTWLLAAAAPAAAEIYLRIDERDAVALSKASMAATLELAWRNDGVDLTLAGAFGVERLHATTAIVHQSKNCLYASLPLADFDLGAKRFWQRIFAVMRIPGGRFLLKFMARSNR